MARALGKDGYSDLGGQFDLPGRSAEARWGAVASGLPGNQLPAVTALTTRERREACRGKLKR
jgi:hypothetical protein